jgi:superfamily II RNA helicase
MLYCTSTFALGINMPARTAAFDALRKYDGRSLRPLTTREFMQKAGRAGRRGMDDVGHVVVRMEHNDWDLIRDHIQELLRGEPEPVHSSFSLSFHSIVNLLSQHSLTQVEAIVDQSFLNWAGQGEAQRHQRDAERIGRLLDAGEAPKGAEKERNRLLERAERAEGRCRAELDKKLTFLQDIGYLGEDLSFNPGAKILLNVQIEEIFVTELILAGVFESLPPDLTFGLLCAVNKEFGRDVTPRERLRGDALRLAKDANKIRFSGPVQKAEQLTGIEVTWCPEMIPYGALWARGQSFAALMLSIDSPTDNSGDLVGAFRRAKDLIGQLKLVYADDPSKREELAKLLSDVSREEVLVVD